MKYEGLSTNFIKQVETYRRVARSLMTRFSPSVNGATPNPITNFDEELA